MPRGDLEQGTGRGGRRAQAYRGRQAPPLGEPSGRGLGRGGPRTSAGRWRTLNPGPIPGGRFPLQGLGLTSEARMAPGHTAQPGTQGEGATMVPKAWTGDLVRTSSYKIIFGGPTTTSETRGGDPAPWGGKEKARG